MKVQTLFRAPGEAKEKLWVLATRGGKGKLPGWVSGTWLDRLNQFGLWPDPVSPLLLPSSTQDLSSGGIGSSQTLAPLTSSARSPLVCMAEQMDGGGLLMPGLVLAPGPKV